MSPGGEASATTALKSALARPVWTPGQHAYLHCPGQSLGGHPFTIANIPQSLFDTADERPDETVQEFVIRVRGGLTKQLMETAHRGAPAKVARRTDERIAAISRAPVPVPIVAWTDGPCE